jgi:IS30 family transposase
LRDHGEFDVFGLLIRRNRSKASWALAAYASMFHRLRSDRSIRCPLGKRSSYGRGQIRNTVSIRERPVEADTREVAGHRERLTRASTRRCAVSHGVARQTRCCPP